MSQVLCKQNISRLLAVLLAVALLLACAPAALAAEGSCGEDLTWSLSDGTLTISGSGAMTDYGDGHMPPWYGSREEILQLSLPGGLTHIGSAAFYGCEGLTSVSIPGSVNSIGQLAFSNCSGMTMLSLNSGLQEIADNAFEMCRSLQDLRIPGTVTSIGHHAFYFCTSLSYVSVPGSVTSFGSGIFSYCENLMQADIEASMTDLPGWTFYGCNKLTTVNVQGASVSASVLKVPNYPTVQDTPQQPTAPVVPQQPTIPVVPQQSTTPVTPQQPTTSAVPQQPTVTQPPQPEETVAPVQENSGENSITAVEKTENVTFVNTITGVENGDRTDLHLGISATVVEPKGWEEVVTKVEEAFLLPNESEEPLNVTVMLQNEDTIPEEVLKTLSGKNVALTVQTQSGSRFALDCTKLPETVKKDLKLTYSLTLLDEVPAGMEGCTVYQLSFDKSSDIQTEMTMRLPGNHSFQTATLYRMDKKEPVQLQSVLVDDSGNAHWYLRSIDHKQTYLIGINIPGADTESPIIPAELAGVYKVANVYDGVEYVVTGRTSSWNMGLGRVMAILAVVMVSAIVVVGFVMFTLNKRRLKNGYVPQWLDEDEE